MTISRFDIKLYPDQIKDVPGTVHWEFDAGRLPLLDEIGATGECSFNGQIVCDLESVNEFGRIKVRGKISVPLLLNCSRCLCEFETTIASAFTIYFTKGRPDQFTEEEEVELASEDLVSAYYSGDEIDLSHEIAEQIAMSLPLKPLCVEACSGLCQDCGVNLNFESCDCSSTRTGFSFSALKNFRVNS